MCSSRNKRVRIRTPLPSGSALLYILQDATEAHMNLEGISAMVAQVMDLMASVAEMTQENRQISRRCQDLDS